MSPRILAVSGPNEGTSLTLPPAECGVGSGPSNDLVLLDESVAPRHCVIQGSGDEFTLVSLDSRRRVFVNGLPVGRRRLRHGDTLQIGESVLVFLQPDLTPAPPEALIREADFLAGKSLEVVPEEALSSLSERVEAALQKGDPLAGELNALLRISGDLATVKSVGALGSHLLDLVLEVIPAQRSVVLLIAPDESETLIGQRRRGRDSGAALRISRTVVRRVADHGVALLCTDVQQSDLSTVESLRIERIQSVLCAPLLEKERTAGVIYLDTKDPESGFGRQHLLFLTAAASLASMALQRVRFEEDLESENRRLRTVSNQFGMVGECPPMLRIFDFISRIAPTDSTVLIRGESGTGKDLAARALHAGSSRSAKTFHAINCAALSETLIESELFGHEKGAFTGAAARRLGKLEAADGGTVFLDEVGELPASIQAKLLRVLEKREFERLGGNQTVHVDIRLVAATNRDLEKAIESGDFRRDLYYRLNVISFEMPPLRERGRDVVLLAGHFLERLRRRLNRPGLRLSPAAEAVLLHYEWPGNVRELANALERASVLAPGVEIRPEDLPESTLETDSPDLNITRYHEALNRVKKEMILRAVTDAGGNITEAAGQLGLHPNYLHRLISKLGLREKL